MDQVWLGEKKDAGPTCLASPSLSHLPPDTSSRGFSPGPGRGGSCPPSTCQFHQLTRCSPQDQALRGRDEARGQLSEPSLKQDHSRCSEEVSEEETELGGWGRGGKGQDETEAELQAKG